MKRKILKMYQLCSFSFIYAFSVVIAEHGLYRSLILINRDNLRNNQSPALFFLPWHFMIYKAIKLNICPHRIVQILEKALDCPLQGEHQARHVQRELQHHHHRHGGVGWSDVHLAVMRCPTMAG